MQISAASTTAEILRELGERLQAYRLQQNLSVEVMAERSGVSARTLNRIEAGENTSLENLVKLLRALGRVDALDAFLPAPLVSPIQLAKNRGHARRRAGGSRPSRKTKPGSPTRSPSAAPRATSAQATKVHDD